MFLELIWDILHYFLTKEDLRTAIELQFNVKSRAKDIQQLQQKSSELKSNKLSSNFTSFQHAFLCGSERHKDAKGSCRNKQVLTELACRRIEEAPFLVDLHDVTNWDILFRSNLGELKEFLFKTFKNKTQSFQFLELSPGKYVKALTHCTLEEFKTALDELDSKRTSACIVSLLVSSINLVDAPMALLANHMQNVLMRKTGRNYQEGCEQNIQQTIMVFTLQCFELIPFEILCCIARKVS